MPSSTFGSLSFVICYLLLSVCAQAQEVQTIELYTSQVQLLNARLGNACLIQLPVEPIATNVGDPTTWLVEKSERLVSIKPIQEMARDTNLAIVTRQGTVSFSIRLGSQSEPFTQMTRITKIVDDSKPLPPQSPVTNETLAETIIREMRIAQNYYALKTANSPELRNVDQWTLMRETERKTYRCTVLQTFRFRDTRHAVLHFITENQGETPLAFDARKTTVNLGDTLFAPVAVSFGQSTLAPKRSAEHFIVLDGANGLSHRQEFNILLVVVEQPPAITPTCAP